MRTQGSFFAVCCSLVGLSERDVGSRHQSALEKPEHFKANSATVRAQWVMCAPTAEFRLELFLVGDTSIGEAHNFVDRHLSLQSIKDVLPPPVLHEVDALRTFSDQCSPPRKGNGSINPSNETCSKVEVLTEPGNGAPFLDV